LIGEDTILFRKKLLEVLDYNENILIDLSDCKYMDSAGIGEMVRSLMTVQDRKGKLKMMNLSKKVKDLFYNLRLISTFKIYGDETEAVMSFYKKAIARGQAAAKKASAKKKPAKKTKKK
ncbi:STAS domain-containing protein, partial [Candidatus Dependentiae bacterium]|nr:STAS domain-containing protein [Candidatus Dependentiae bacterium]